MSTVRFTNEASLQNFQQLDVVVDPKQKLLWLYMKPHPRPCFNMEICALGERAW